MSSMRRPPTTARWFWASAVFAANITNAGTASAQADSSGHRTKSSVKTWQVEHSNRGPGRSVHARNDGAVPIEITGVRFVRCKNISLPCETAVPIGKVLAAGGQESIIDVRPASLAGNFSFGVEVEWRFADECMREVVPEASDTARGASEPSMAALVLPDISGAPKQVRGRPFTIRYYIAATGAPDSIQVIGVTDAKFVGRLRKELSSTRFVPARIHGCPIPSTHEITLTVGH
jgi:hypothetical protein